MFSREKRTVPLGAPSFFGWTEDKLTLLRKTLEHDRPQFRLNLDALRTSFGRKVYAPEASPSENQLLGKSDTYRARAEGRFGLAPIGTVGGLGASCCEGEANTHNALITFTLDLLTIEQEWQLQRILQTAFAAEKVTTIALVLLPVDDPRERVRELREEGGFDALPLHSFNIWTDAGAAIFDA